MRFATLASSTVVAVVLAMWAPTASAEDGEGCKDLWLTRMSGFSLTCEDADFDAFEFAEGTDKATKVEGRIVTNHYETDVLKPPSKLAVQRNYENAFRQAGWSVVLSNSEMLTVRQTVAGQERWAELRYNEGNRYQLVLAQKAGMTQSVASAADMLATLNKDGRIALHVNFDTAKATIKADSQAIVSQLVELLQSNPSLKLSIEGHTDNAGTPASNKLLSENRAKAVIAALVASGINASRLTAAGFGQDRPVADNSSEDGRAKNRRVELVRR